MWVHIKCNYTSKEKYNEYIQEDNEINCSNCTNGAMSFINLPNEKLKLTLQGKNFDDNPCFSELLNYPPEVNIYKDLEEIDIAN